MSNFIKFYELDRNLNYLIRNMKWNLWDNQDKVSYRDKAHKYPTLTSDAYDVITKAFDEEVEALRDDICMAFLDYYYRDIIDPGENRQMLEEYFGWEYPDWESNLPEEVYLEHNHERMTRPAFLSYLQKIFVDECF